MTFISAMHVTRSMSSPLVVKAWTIGALAIVPRACCSANTGVSSTRRRMT
jgi:hypothetical protein